MLDSADRAIKSITAASAGVPRLINLLCDRTMSRAAEMFATFVSADHVNSAMNDLKWPRAPATSIFWEGDDEPRAVSRSDETPRRSRNLTDLNVGELGLGTAPFLEERTLGQLAATSSQPATPPAAKPALEEPGAGALGLLVAPEVSPRNATVAPSRSVRCWGLDARDSERRGVGVGGTRR